MKKMKLMMSLLLSTCVIGCSQKNDIHDQPANLQQVESDHHVVYLWEKENMPTETNYIKNTNHYFDDPDFKPYMTVYDVPEGTEIKGAMLISPGGAFEFRSERTEGKEVAERFAQLGYVSFVVHYRVLPYTERESGLDVARAIKIVRYHAKEYGIDENQIAVVGFSAGGIANGRAVLEFGTDIDGKTLDDGYVPDEIDRISSSPNAVIIAYSFYGRLSHANLEADTFGKFNLPPTYYVYGTEDPFYLQFNAQVDLLQELHKEIGVQVFDRYPHGFGIRGQWAEMVDQWLEEINKD